MKPERTRRVALACVIFLALESGQSFAAAAPAPAQSQAETAARQHFRLAEAHYSAGRFVAALGEYEAGYASDPLPGFLVNMAQCHRRLGDLPRARSVYQKFVLVAPDSPLVPEIRGLIRELDRLLEPSGSPTPAPHSSRPTLALESPASLIPLGARDPAGAGQPPEGAQLTATADVPSNPSSRSPTSSHWWFWGAVAAVALGGVAAIVALSPGGPNTIHDGTLGTLRR